MAQSPRSGVWVYFQIVQGDKTKALCKVWPDKGDHTILSRGGKQNKNLTTTNLRNHLRRHPKEFFELSANNKEQKSVAEKRKQEKADSTTTTMRKKIKSQMSLQQSFEVCLPWDMNSPSARHITNLIGEMMVLDNQPFMIAEDLGFVRLMKHVSPRYRIPSRHHFSETVIPSLVKRAEAAVAKLLEGAEHLSFTSESWTLTPTPHSSA